MGWMDWMDGTNTITNTTPNQTASEMTAPNPIRDHIDGNIVVEHSHIDVDVDDGVDACHPGNVVATHM